MYPLTWKVFQDFTGNWHQSYGSQIRLDALGGLTLGTGTVLDSFHILGWTPCLIAALAMDAKGSPSMWETSWNI